MIRKYQDHDLDSLLELWYRASRQAHPFLDEAFLRQERDAITGVHMLKAETWVYVRQTNVVGFISLLGNEVGGFFVDPTVQGEGIGRALMDHARLLREELEVEVFKANSIGRRFYDRYGFVFVKEHVDEQTGQLVLRMRVSGS
jgi:putative acetyltransferase